MHIRDLFCDAPLANSKKPPFDLNPIYQDRFLHATIKILYYCKNADISYYSKITNKSFVEQTNGISAEINRHYQEFVQYFSAIPTSIPPELVNYKADLNAFMIEFDSGDYCTALTSTENSQELQALINFPKTFRDTKKSTTSSFDRRIKTLLAKADDFASALSRNIEKAKKLDDLESRFEIDDLLKIDANKPLRDWMQALIASLLDAAKKYSSDDLSIKWQRIKYIFLKKNEFVSPIIQKEMCHDNSQIGQQLSSLISRDNRMIMYGVPISLVSWFSLWSHQCKPAETEELLEIDLEEVINQIFVKSTERIGRSKLEAPQFRSLVDLGDMIFRKKTNSSKRDWTVLSAVETDELTKSFDNTAVKHPGVFAEVIHSKLAVDLLAPFGAVMQWWDGFSHEFPKRDSGRPSKEELTQALDSVVRPFFEYRYLCILEWTYPSRPVGNLCVLISDQENEMFGPDFTKSVGMPITYGSSNVCVVKSLLLNPLNEKVTRSKNNNLLFYFLWQYQNRSPIAKEIYAAILGSRQANLHKPIPISAVTN